MNAYPRLLLFALTSAAVTRIVPADGYLAEDTVYRDADTSVKSLDLELDTIEKSLTVGIDHKYDASLTMDRTMSTEVLLETNAKSDKECYAAACCKAVGEEWFWRNGDKKRRDACASTEAPGKNCVVEEHSPKTVAIKKCVYNGGDQACAQHTENAMAAKESCNSVQGCMWDDTFFGGSCRDAKKPTAKDVTFEEFCPGGTSAAEFKEKEKCCAKRTSWTWPGHPSLASHLSYVDRTEWCAQTSGCVFKPRYKIFSWIPYAGQGNCVPA